MAVGRKEPRLALQNAGTTYADVPWSHVCGTRRVGFPEFHFEDRETACGHLLVQHPSNVLRSRILLQKHDRLSVLNQERGERIILAREHPVIQLAPYPFKL